MPAHYQGVYLKNVLSFHSNQRFILTFPSDFRHPGERPVGRHDGQREAAAVVPADGGG